MSCDTIPLEGGGKAIVCSRARPRKSTPPPPPVHTRRIVGLTLPAPWHVLVALGLCPVVSLPEAPRYLWAEWVALHVPAVGDEYQGRLAHHLAQRARVEVPEEHPLAQVRGAVVAVAQVEPLLFVSPGRGRAASPWCHGPALGQVVDVLPIHPVPTPAFGDAASTPWELPEALRQEVARAFKVARRAREHVRQQEVEEGALVARAERLEQEVDELLRLRLEEDGAPPAVPQLPTRVEVAEVLPEDPLEALFRRERESQARLRQLVMRYARYERSAQAMDTRTGIRGYRCPECQEWFCWSPGLVEHVCATAVSL